MVDSYAWGAQNGILQGASDLTGALLGYPLALDRARRQRLQEEQAQAELARQHGRQDVSDAFFAEDRQRRHATEDQAAAEHRTAQIYAGNIDVPAAQPMQAGDPTGYNPNGTPTYSGEDTTGMQPNTFEQDVAQRGVQERQLKDDVTLAGIDRKKEMTAKGAATGGTTTGGRKLTPTAALAEAERLAKAEVGLDANGKQLPHRPERVLEIQKRLLESGDYVRPPAAPAGPATAAAHPDVEPHPGAFGGSNIPSAEAFNAAQDESDRNPFIPPAMRGTDLAATFGRQDAAVHGRPAPWHPPAAYAEQYARIVATGDPARIAEAERRLGKP